MIKTKIGDIEECQDVLERVKMIRSDKRLNRRFEKFHERANVCESGDTSHAHAIIYLNHSKKSRFCRDCRPVNSKKRKLVQESDSDELKS